MSHQPVRHYFPLEAHQQSIPEMEQWNQDFAISHREHQPQHQQTHQTQSNLFNSQHHIHNQTRQMQQHLQPQSKYQQHLLYHSKTQFAQHQQTVKQPFTQAHVQIQDPQMSEEQYRCTRRWQLPCQQGQYQGHLHQPHQQPLHPVPLPNAQEERWTHLTNPQTQGKQPFRSCVQTHEQPKPQSESEGKSISDSREGGKVPSSSSNEGFELNKVSALAFRQSVSSSDYPGLTKAVRVRINHAGVSLYVPVLLQESYVGLHLTPRQAKALSQQVHCFCYRSFIQVIFIVTAIWCVMVSEILCCLLHSLVCFKRSH